MNSRNNKSKRSVIKYGEFSGISLDENGMSISLNNLPVASHFFSCSDFKVKDIGSSIAILFGQRSAFSDTNILNTAVEVRLQKDFTLEAVYSNHYKRPSLKNEKPFIEVLHEILRSKSLEVKEQTNDLKVPQTESAYRLFHVNYMNASYSNGQVLLEFFLVSPELISSLSQGYKPRENSRVKNIISIIGSLPVMTSFLDAFGSCIKEEIKYDE